jgi:hypothetical protein
MCKYR